MGIDIILYLLLFCVICYMLVIMPRMFCRPDQTIFKKYIYAHRGVHDNTGDAPENSLAAFLKAVDRGYGIELDIQVTKDKVPVVFHDFTLTRMTGCKKKVNELTLAEIRKLSLRNSKETIPTLAEVLDLVNGKVPLIVEFKVERFDLSICETAVPMLDAYQGSYCMESFNPLVLRWFKKNRNQIVRGQLSDEFIHEKEPGNPVILFILAKLMFNFITKPDFISYRHSHANNLSLVICKHIYKTKTAAWTIKNQFEYDKNEVRFDYLIFDHFIPR